MSTAISGLNTTLYCGDSATALTKLCDIKDVPDLISEPNLLDATTLTPSPLLPTTTRLTTRRSKKLATMRLPRATP